MNMQWASLMRLARCAANLTPEDFASDFGRSCSLVGQRESGRKLIPQHMQGAILDILSGYYNSMPEIKHIEEIANGFKGHYCMFFQKNIRLFENKNLLNICNDKCSADFKNARILPHLPSDCLVMSMTGEYTLNIIDGKSDCAQLSVFDKSALPPDCFVRREITPIRVGVGAVLLVREKAVHLSQAPSQKLGARAIARDGTEEVLFRRRRKQPGGLFRPQTVCSVARIRRRRFRRVRGDVFALISFGRARKRIGAFRNLCRVSPAK